MVLQSVKRNQTGLYSCVGHNQEGEGESIPIPLNIKCKWIYSTNLATTPKFLVAPVCRAAQTHIYSIAKGETTRIVCDLEANPGNLQFFWSFNSTSENVTQNQVSSDGTRSTLSYTPNDDMVYGTLLCWGSNEIGVQKQPCVYHLNAAGKFLLIGVGGGELKTVLIE